MRVVHTIMCPRASKRLMISTKVDVEQKEEVNVTTAAFPASEPETAVGVGVGRLLKDR